MKLAIGIITLFLMIAISFQSCAINIGSSIENNSDMGYAGGCGMIVAFFFLIAGSFVFKLPKVAIIFFVLSTITAFLIASNSNYGDMKYWGIISIILALLSYFIVRNPNHHQDKEISK